jgi:hypothetical protein
VLVAEYFARWLLAGATMLDLGCGHCEFINNVRPKKRFGMDLNPLLTIPNRSVFPRVADEINFALEKHFRLCAALLVMLLLVCAVVRDVREKMWIDELYTLHMAQQASLGEIVKATLEGCDGAAPLYAMVVHLILPWVRPEALPVRLPSSLGFCGMVFCLLAFCRRRLPALYSLVAVLLVCNACLGYSIEGRCYGLVLCCAAGALLCWQAAADGQRRIVAIPLLAFCLALMTALHFLSIFFLVPLFLAEMTRWRRSGKLDVAVLVAMASALFVLGLHYPFIAAGKQFQEHYYARASWDNIWDMSVYVRMFAPLGLLAVFSMTPQDRTASEAGLTLPEWVAVGALSLMPFCILVLSIYITHIFLVRYTLWAATGIAVLVAALLCVAARGRSAVGVSALGLLLALLALRESYSLLKRPALRECEAVFHELASLPDGSEPIVVADHHVFMELSYYEALPLRERLIYPVNRDLDLRYLGTDTGALLMSALSHRSKLHIVGYDALLAAHPRFVLAAGQGDYLPWHLVTAGYRVVPISSSMRPLLYEVEAPGRKK